MFYVIPFGWRGMAAALAVVFALLCAFAWPRERHSVRRVAASSIFFAFFNLAAAWLASSLGVWSVVFGRFSVMGAFLLVALGFFAGGIFALICPPDVDRGFEVISGLALGLVATGVGSYLGAVGVLDFIAPWAPFAFFVTYWLGFGLLAWVNAVDW